MTAVPALSSAGGILLSALVFVLGLCPEDSQSTDTGSVQTVQGGCVPGKAGRPFPFPQ